MTFLATIPYIDPKTIDFGSFAARICEALSQYNVANPVNEDLWQYWADQICSIPDIAKRGALSPETFGTWRQWATTFIQVMN